MVVPELRELLNFNPKKVLTRGSNMQYDMYKHLKVQQRLSCAFMKNRILSFKLVQKRLFAAIMFPAAFFMVALVGGTQAQAQNEIWTAASDNYTNGADWNPAIMGTPTNW